MPTVPTYNDQQAAPSSDSGARFNAAPVDNFSGQQMQEAGNALQHAGATATNIAVDMQQQVNQVRVIDAANQAKEAEFDLLYNKDTGALNLKGKAAIEAYKGKGLATATAEKYKEATDKISATLGNDQQRALFAEHVGTQHAQLYGTVEHHVAGEYQSYQSATFDAAVTAAQRQIGMYGITGIVPPSNRPGMTAIDDNAERIVASVKEKARIVGMPQSMADEVAQAEVSKGYVQAIEGALQNGNLGFANTLLTQKKDGMVPGDILRVQGLLTHQLDGMASMTAVQGAFTKLKSQIAPTDMDRLHSIVMGMESGGNPNAVGKNIPGQGTAKGAMQVMDATMMKPGFGLPELPANATPQQRTEQGHKYLDALVKKYGNPALAMAAYNAGPGRLDEAMAAATKAGKPDAWLESMPKETQAYVSNGMAKLGAGGGAPSFPTESQFVQAALDNLGVNPRVEQVLLVQQQAAAQYTMLDKSRKEQGEQAVMSAHQALIKNGGNFAALDPQIKADVQRLAPDKYDNLPDFAGKIADPVRADNLSAYNQAIGHPDEMAKMSDATFESFIKQNFTQITARALARERQDQIDGKIDTSAQGINRPAVNRSLNNALASLGIPTEPTKGQSWGPKEQERIGGIRAYVDNSIFAAQAQAGHKFTAEQVQQHVAKLFSTDVTFKNTLWYGGTETTSQKLMSITVPDLPSGAYDGLRKSLIASGNRAPTDNDVINLYRRMHAPK